MELPRQGYCLRKGQVVDVFASGHGIYVTMKGLVLEDGSLDSFVRIKNLSSEKNSMPR